MGMQHPKVDAFIEVQTVWKAELSALRSIILECGLDEDYKWKVPCYTYGKSNIVLIHGFKEYCAIAFFKGVLLKDEENVLIQQTENVQSGRQIRFQNIQQIKDLTTTIKAYIFEAIEVEKAGLKVEMKKVQDFDIPEELTQKMESDKDFASAFEKLTPGRKKAYYLFFNGAKQAATRISRIEKYTDRIMKGIGLNDCVCGLSKRMPNCDGSHKILK